MNTCNCSYILQSIVCNIQFFFALLCFWRRHWILSGLGSMPQCSHSLRCRGLIAKKLFLKLIIIRAAPPKRFFYNSCRRVINTLLSGTLKLLTDVLRKYHFGLTFETEESIPALRECYLLPQHFCYQWQQQTPPNIVPMLEDTLELIQLWISWWMYSVVMCQR